jgi:hypothetical protein
MGNEAAPTPALHVRELLARAQNPFDVTDAVLERLRGAVVYEVRPQAVRRRDAPPHSGRCHSYRHNFLLRDGSCLALWELRYTSADGRHPLHEVYESAEALTASQRRLQLTTSARPFTGSDEHTHTDSPDHARRLLRRAENDDRPGEDVRQVLATALAHEILPVSRPRGLAREWRVWCSVYEHSFLLADGSEMRLYELEHNLSGSGRLTCEVYLEAAVADQAAHRHARARGLDS